MTPAEAKDLWEAVKANREALDACAGPHEFVDIAPQKSIGKDYRCTKCGGQVESLHRFWYERGLKHGKDSA